MAISCTWRSTNCFSKVTRRRWSGRWPGLPGSPELKTSCSPSNLTRRPTTDGSGKHGTSPGVRWIRQCVTTRKKRRRSWQVNAALREAEFGNTAVAKQGVAAALALAPGRDVRLFAALALARVGETARAKAIVEELEKNYPSDTVLKVYWLPTIKAAMELNANNSTQALMILEAAAPYELGQPLNCSWEPCIPPTFAARRS